MTQFVQDRQRSSAVLRQTGWSGRSCSIARSRPSISILFLKVWTHGLLLFLFAPECVLAGLLDTVQGEKLFCARSGLELRRDNQSPKSVKSISYPASASRNGPAPTDEQKQFSPLVCSSAR